jgi:glycosyltransferase involved in cell wall biosynthesis
MTDVVLPCLDEAAALPWVLDRIPRGYRAIVSDNGSTDGSPEIAAAHGAVVVRVPERGFGAAVHAGLLAADRLAGNSTMDDDLVCIVDADGSFDPGQLPRVAEPVRAGEVDLMLGRRRPTAPGAWPPHARLGNGLVAWRLRRTTGVRVYDIGPMRAARRQALLALDLRDRRFGYPLEMVIHAARAGWRIAEVDIDYAPRAPGTRSKVTGTVSGTVRTIRDMARVLAA